VIYQNKLRGGFLYLRENAIALLKVLKSLQLRGLVEELDFFMNIIVTRIKAKRKGLGNSGEQLGVSLKFCA
jgi:hypothetical protein